MCNLWAQATDWRHLLHYNLAYIQGQVDCSPSYPSEPIHPETARLVPGLKRLHEYGLLTTDSQPFDDTRQATGKRKEWKQTVQRAYLWVLVPTVMEEIPVEKVDMLVESILSHPDVLATVHSECDAYPASKPGVRETDVAPLDGTGAGRTYHFRTTTVLGDNVVSRDRTGKTQLLVRDAKWVDRYVFPVTSVDDVHPGDHLCGMGVGGQGFAVVERMRPLAIGVMAREWGKVVDKIGRAHV